ncbi:uncharacterized protein LOC143223067 [Tachypleus tridentatus]|uniref:uncharacterized protein LOC143223067 n=1 Tax=Tachypleus tridentatus TaxID=6853 RepID=UPI003FD130E2
MPVRDQDKPWAPHFTCAAKKPKTKKKLEGWYRGEKRIIKFAIPIIWREPTNYLSNCYFCMVDPFNVGLARMHLLSCIWTFHHPSPQYHTVLSSLYLLCQRGSNHPQKRAANQKRKYMLKIQFTILEVQLVRETRTTPTKETSMT